MSADRLAARLGLREVWVKNETANPTHSFKDRVVSVALARAIELGFETLACASTGNLANAVAAHAAAAGLPSYVFIPSDLEQEKILATGAYGTHVVGVRGNYDDVNRLCTELSGDREVGVRQRQHAAVLRRGLQDARLRDRRAARLGAARPRRRADRLRVAVHEGRARLRGVASTLGLLTGDLPTMNGAQAEGCSPVAQAFAAGHDFCRPSSPDTIAKSLAIGNPADGPYAVDLARRTGGVDRRVTDDEIRAGIRLLAETTGIFTETAGGVTTATLAKLAERGDIDPAERVVLVITGDGLKTLDAVRDTFEVAEIAPTRSTAFEAHRVGAGVGGDGLMAVTVKIPTQLRSVTGGAAETDGRGLHRRRGARLAVRATPSCATRIAGDDGGLRRFVNIYLAGEDIRFLDGLDTPVPDGAELTILPAVAGG